MKVVDIASEIFRELGEPTEITIPVIAYWLRSNIGKLNSIVYKQYRVNETTFEVECLNPNDPTNTLYEEIGIDEVALFKLLYIVHYYDLQIRKNMLNYDTRRAIEVSSDGHTVRLASPTEIGKTLYMFRKMITDDLNRWIAWYRLAKSTPRQVVGDDTVEGPVYTRPMYRRTYFP